MNETRTNGSGSWPFPNGTKQAVTLDEIVRQMAAAYTAGREATWLVISPDGKVYRHGNPMVAAAIAIGQATPDQIKAAEAALSDHLKANRTAPV